MRKDVSLHKTGCTSAIKAYFIAFGLHYLYFDDAKVEMKCEIFFRSKKKFSKKLFWGDF